MFTKIKNYIKPVDAKLTYMSNKINLVNYNKIKIFDNDKIVIDCLRKLVIIEGNNLIITRLFNDELLIEGTIDSIAFEDLNV